MRQRHGIHPQPHQHAAVAARSVRAASKIRARAVRARSYSQHGMLCRHVTLLSLPRGNERCQPPVIAVRQRWRRYRQHAAAICGATHGCQPTRDCSLSRRKVVTPPSVTAANRPRPFVHASDGADRAEPADSNAAGNDLNAGSRSTKRFGAAGASRQRTREWCARYASKT